MCGSTSLPGGRDGPHRRALAPGRRHGRRRAVAEALVCAYSTWGESMHRAHQKCPRARFSVPNTHDPRLSDVPLSHMPAGPTTSAQARRSTIRRYPPMWLCWSCCGASGRNHAEQDARHERGQDVLCVCAQDSGAGAGEGAHRWTRLVSPCGARDAWPRRAPWRRSLHEQPH